MATKEMTFMQNCRQRSRACIASYEKLRMADDAKLAKLLDVHISTVRRKKEDPGTFTMDEMWKLAMYLKCPVGQLCGGELPEELIEKWLAAGIKAM